MRLLPGEVSLRGLDGRRRRDRRPGPSGSENAARHERLEGIPIAVQRIARREAEEGVIGCARKAEIKVVANVEEDGPPPAIAPVNVFSKLKRHGSKELACARITAGARVQELTRR